ncbi:HAD family phosphatase [bacterium]|nr:HAD family phosphatase [candidate division CSSED10-310 bacterium]
MKTLEELFRDQEAVLLDFDGTLADSEPYHYLTNRAAFAIYGHHIDEAEYYLFWTSKGEGPAGEIRRHGLRAIDPEKVREHKRCLFQEVCESGAVKLFPETAELLACLACSSMAAAIVTNSERSHVEAVLATNGVPKPGVPIITGGAGFRPKPHPDLLLHAADVLDTAPRRCVVIEDTEKGLEAARAAGMRCSLVPVPYLTIDVRGAADGMHSLSALLEFFKKRFRKGSGDQW